MTYLFLLVAPTEALLLGSYMLIELLSCESPTVASDLAMAPSLSTVSIALSEVCGVA